MNSNYTRGQAQITSDIPRKTKIVCTIGPSTSSLEMIWKLSKTGMNVARLNMSHGDHASHQKTIDLVKEYNAQFEEKVVAIMLDTKIAMTKSSCKLALKELDHWMRPQKVIADATTLLVKNKDI